ncbi:MAG: polyprenol phosphomannose-dependent alpha 1,6 mannosyltransferase MptB [Acidimicrobiales bacterium]
MTSGLARTKRLDDRPTEVASSDLGRSASGWWALDRLRIPLWVSTLLGLVGYGGMVATGTQLAPLPNQTGPWWFSLPVGHLGLLRILFYLATVIAIVGWLGVGVAAWRGELSLRATVVILAVWSVPLLIGPPNFSKDVYSYIGQGLIAHRGLNPYRVSPSVLGPGPLLNSIASVWQKSPAPYGPFFVEIARGITAVVGRSIVQEVLVMRALEIAGMALMVAFVPRLAKQLGSDPGVALWLGVLSPLVLLSFMASGHNDCLMVGLMVAGVSLSLDGRRTVGLVLCSLGALIKAPAAAAVLFLAVDELRLSERGRRMGAVVAKVIAVPLVTVVVVTLSSGLGWRWLQPQNLRIPAQLRIDATPTVSIGVAISRILGLVRIHVSQAGTVTVVQAIGGVIAVAAAVWLIVNLRHDNVVRVLAVLLLVVVLAGPTLWPWYLTWGLVLLAATPSQRSRVLAIAAAFAMLLAGPVGTPQLAGYWYWVVSLATVAGCVWLASDRRWASALLGRPANPMTQ